MNVYMNDECIDLDACITDVVALSLPDTDIIASERTLRLNWLVEMPERALKDAVYILIDANECDRAAFVQRALLIKQATECERPLRRRLA